MSDAITIRVLFEPNAYRDDGNVEDIDFPAVPKIGEAIFLLEHPPHCSTWIVKEVGYMCTSGTAMPCIEVEEYEPGLAPSGRFDRMIAGS